MNASKTHSLNYLKLLFQNLPIAGIGDAAGLQPSAVAGNLYIRFCTDEVAVDADTLGTESAYTGYVAGGVAIPRTEVAWNVAYDDVTLKAIVSAISEIVFGDCTGNPQTVKYVECWANNTSNLLADRITFYELPVPIAITAGMTPRIQAGLLKFLFS